MFMAITSISIARDRRLIAGQTTLLLPPLRWSVGEGGSGGAIGIGLANCLMVMEHAFYSVISPEGCAAILWKDAAKCEDAAKSLRLTAQDLVELKIADEIVKEPLGGAHRDHQGAADSLKEAIVRNLDELTAMDTDELLEQRYEKYRKIGFFGGGNNEGKKS